MGKPITGKEARSLIMQGQPLPAGSPIKGLLDLSKAPLTTLPSGLEASIINLSGCRNLTELPADLKVRKLIIDDCPALKALPAGFACYELVWRRAAISAFPADVRVTYRLDLSGSAKLRELPANMTIGTLDLSDCTALETLPEGLKASRLILTNCVNLRQWPQRGDLDAGSLVLRNCVALNRLPDWLTVLAQLDLSGCEGIRALPQSLDISAWIEIADSALEDLSPHINAQIRWRGIPITRRIAFAPETLAAEEVLGEANLEVRRAMLERIGYETFFERAEAEELDRDTDPGGLRRLLRVEIPDDEALVCLAVQCPSTERRYMLRVPPTTRSCHQAAAWIAGFDDPSAYRPVQET